MSAGRFRLDRPPIIEAVVDITCDLPPGLDLTALQDRAKAAFRDAYPRAGRQVVQSHEFSAQPEKPPEFAMRQKIGALMFRSEDEKQVVQVRLEGYSFNRLAPYSSLDDYLPEINARTQPFRRSRRRYKSAVSVCATSTGSSFRRWMVRWSSTTICG
jgi:uncharacterized protein (TIGR04255 family)